MRQILLLAVAGGVACGASKGRDDVPAGHAREASDAGPGEGGGSFDDEEPNTRWVLGAALDAEPYTPAGASHYFSLRTSAKRGGAAQKVSLAGAASLTSRGVDGTFSGADRRFGGLVFSEGALRITLQVTGGDASITHYSARVQKGKGPVVQVCEDAIPLAGIIDRTGKHVASPDRITLACSDGAAHKCAVWGYPPGSSGSALWGAHQACMQMVTANYCGDGEAPTRVGTSIRFYDAVGVHPIPDGLRLPAITARQWPPNTEDYYFEAAFTGQHDEAVCLGKLRWPLITSRCAAKVPDCPDRAGVDDLVDKGAVLLVASKYNQLRLDRWQRKAGRHVDRVATVRGYFNAADQEIKPPWDGYTHEGHDGVLLRVPPGSAPHLIEVAMFESLSGEDRFVARSDDRRFADPRAFRRDGFEGYAFPAPSNKRLPLRLYRRGEAKASMVEHVSTTLDPSAMAALGYELAPDASGSAIIGWIPAAP
jgi:ADYC domain